MNIIDLSHTITTDMPVFPGSDNPEINWSSTVAEDGFAEKKFSLQSHHGTHIDAPAHIIKQGAYLDDLPIDQFIGEALCIDISGPKIDETVLVPYSNALEEVEFVLFHSGWSRYWGDPRYFCNYPVLTMETATMISKTGIKGVGFDTISVDREDSPSLPVHNILLEKMIIVENLCNLEQLPQARFLFSCLPLKIFEADGSPVRAVAIVR